MRAFIRVVSLLLAAAIAAAGVLVVVEVVAAAVGSRPVLVQWPGVAGTLARDRWNDTGPRIAGIALVAAGLLLLLIGVHRGKPNLVPLTSGTPGVTATATRRSLQRSLSSAATDLAGITSARVRVKRRRIRVRAHATHQLTKSDAKTMLRDDLGSRLDSLALLAPRRISVKIKVAKAPGDKEPAAPAGLYLGAPDPEPDRSTAQRSSDTEFTGTRTATSASRRRW